MTAQLPTPNSQLASELTLAQVMLPEDANPHGMSMRFDLPGGGEMDF